ncbi:MAG: sigma 54-interacting transcriptional regulator [Spirochaetales bacterium]|nr:sigma 54-interacting transcriptional regulator [Spirochaetales bacterium]
MENKNKLSLLEEILPVMNSVKSPEELLNYLIDRYIEITGALTGSIMIINPETTELEIKASRGLLSDKTTNVNLKIGEGVTGKVAETGNSLLINDTRSIDYYIRIREDLKSELAVPLKLENKIIGVISVDSDRLNAFTGEHLDILESISNFVAQILKKENLIKDLKDKLSKQDLLLKISEILNETFPLDKLFKKIMKELSETIHIERSILVILDSDDKLRIFDGYKLSDEAKQRGIYQIGEGIIGKVYKYGKRIQIKDISKSKEFLNKMKIWRGKGKNSFFAYPIRYENKNVGVLSLEKKYISDQDFTETGEFIKLITSMISNKVQSYVQTQREKDLLLKTNIELKEKLLEKESGIIFIGKNKKILEILDTVNLVAETDASVLITGETGTGKEILAQLIHYKSLRWDKPFISINCASIPENLLESELFGYKRGAFTGAVKDKKGKFFLADTGTIFLDEIGDLDFNLQAKILRVLQEKIIEPIGSEESTKIDIRVIAATNKDLKKYVKEEKFRDDLFYRLNVIAFHLPPLSQRRDDIPLFIDYFIKQYNTKYNKTIRDIEPGCLAKLVHHEWKGNIRELQNVIERGVILTKGNTLDSSVLPEGIAGETLEKEDLFLEILEQEIKYAHPGEIYKSIMGKIEDYLIDYALIKTNNKQIEAADLLGIHRNTLYQKIKNKSRNIE